MIFPDKPITKKPLEVRMGKGKGALEYLAAVVKPGRMLFEVCWSSYETAKEALRLAAQKLPVKTKFIVSRDYFKLNLIKMKQSEIKEASTAELQENLLIREKHYSDLKMAHAITPLENPIQLKGQRRSIARIATELTKREVQ